MEVEAAKWQLMHPFVVCSVKYVKKSKKMLEPKSIEIKYIDGVLFF